MWGVVICDHPDRTELLPVCDKSKCPLGGVQKEAISCVSPEVLTLREDADRTLSNEHTVDEV